MTLAMELTFGISASIFTMVSILVAWSSHVREQKKTFNDAINKMSTKVYDEWIRICIVEDEIRDKQKNETINRDYFPRFTNQIWASTLVSSPIIKFKTLENDTWEFISIKYFVNPFTKRHKNKLLCMLFTQFDASITNLINASDSEVFHIETPNQIIEEFCVLFAQISNDVNFTKAEEMILNLSTKYKPEKAGDNNGD